MNAGKYRYPITIIKVTHGVDANGFPHDTETVLLTAYAYVRNVRGYMLIKNNTDFEKAYTNFTIRYSQTLVDEYDADNRNLQILYRGKRYIIDYMSDIDELMVEIEMQAKAVTK